MENILARSSYQLFLRTTTTRFACANRPFLRYLTQADVPQAKPASTDKADIATQPGLHIRSTASEKNANKESSKNVASATNSGVRMTAAGILLPKDSVARPDADVKSEPAKRKDKNSVKRSASRDETEREERRMHGLGTTMKAWQITRFGDIAGLKLINDAKIPSLNDPFDLLVQIHAASVNPFDVARTRGYGENLIEKMRDASSFLGLPRLPDLTSLFTRKADPFPITLGRDFSGVVVDAGKAVKGFRTGDEVYGVVGPHRQGTFAEYSATSTWCVARKPRTVTHSEAASVPYIACTAWTAVKLVANLPDRGQNTRVLVLGGAGGVGSFAIQYLKTLGVHVTTICGTEGMVLVTELGADDVIDYKTANIESELNIREKYDVIFQASGNEYEYVKKYLKGNLKSFFVTLTYPLLKNFDDHGSLVGLLKSGVSFSTEYFKGLSKGSHTIWAFFTPNGPFLEEVAGLMDQGKIRPVLGKTFPFNELPAAFAQVDSGDTNGKVVVQIKKDSV
ncbi:Reticulon-4-interacting protein 1, mitochondrial [Hypsibius exemplaris]|uniref:Reticulon-4-interacting protein 1, mitochondrial n=1 Tax=Hypsibius exemplaris TaxID=2072580 RepID=A0A1W0X3M5_HYPEX|nr:Reticulon-4-interacting protein 1, mitochondrial [Hypsibius exemplaris]